MPRDVSKSLTAAARGFVAAAVMLVTTAVAPPTIAGPVVPGVATGKSGLPVPRFVSLKASRANVRIGPGEDYNVSWVFTRAGLPVEVIQEFDTWRRVRDSDGSVGWIFHSLLSGKRTAVVAPWADGEPRPLHARATPDSAITAYLEPGVMASIRHCADGWCRLSGDGFDGWIAQEQLWGVYPGEEID